MKQTTIICYIATLTRGGAERVMAGLANYFADKGYTVYLVTLEPDEGLYPLDERLRQIVMTDAGPVKYSDFPDDGIKYLSKEKYDNDSLSGGNRLLNAIGRITNLRKLIRKTKAKSILAFMGKTNLRAIMAAYGTGCKSFVSVRSAPEQEYPGKFRAFLARLLFCYADGIVFQSKGAMGFFPKACHKRAKIILNPLDESFCRGIPKVSPRREIVTAGRLSGIKNHELLIDAFSIFRRNHPDYTLVIYGEGECRPAMEHQIERLGIKDAVKLPGDEKNIRDRMNGAALFVISSDFEGMPNAIAEAFALRIPVVATDAPSGGIRTLVGKNERGLLVPVGNKEKMAKAMERLLKDEELRDRLVRAGYEFSKKLHPEIIRKQWLDFITDNKDNP